jgi:uncharacterized lipoprotein YajG
MRITGSAINRLVIIGFAIFALAGCAQFQDSFGEITNPDPSPTEYASTAADSEARIPSDRRSDQSLTYGGVRVQLSNANSRE